MTQMEHVEALRPRNFGASYDWDELVQEDRVHQLLYTDAAIFDAEMRNIFGGTWVYLAHESQIANVNDFLTVYIGRGKDDVGDVTRVCIGRIAVNIFNRGQNQTCAKRM